MDKEDIEICNEVIRTFDSFEFKGSISNMVKHTGILQRFARMTHKHKQRLEATNKFLKEDEEKKE